MSRNRLEAICRNIQFELGKAEKNPLLSEKVEFYLNWLSKNQDAPEDKFVAQYQELEEFIDKTGSLKSSDLHCKGRSEFPSRKSKLTSQDCINAGQQILENSPSISI